MGSYYTLHTIFYNSFYVPNIIKIPVLIGFYLLWLKLKKTSLDQLVAVLVFLYFQIRQLVAVACCPFLGQKTRLDWTCEHYVWVGTVQVELQMTESKGSEMVESDRVLMVDGAVIVEEVACCVDENNGVKN